MIKSFRHRGLKRYYEKDDPRYLPPALIGRIGKILGLMEGADSLDGINLPSLRLHKLTGDLKGHWSVSLTGNWRIIFTFEDGEFHNLELIDYH
jgi:proteic killer suppression protein